MTLIEAFQAQFSSLSAYSLALQSSRQTLFFSEKGTCKSELRYKEGSSRHPKRNPATTRQRLERNAGNNRKGNSEGKTGELTNSAG